MCILGNRFKNSSSAVDDVATVNKSGQPPDGFAPSGEGVEESTNPVNPSLFNDPLAGLINGSMLIASQQGPILSLTNSQEARKQLPTTVKQVLVLQSVHACTHACTHVCTHARTYARTHACTHAHTY